MPRDPKRRNQLSPGEYELLRERFDLDPGYRLPPPERVTSLTDLLPQALQSLGVPVNPHVGTLEQEWAALVGRVNAQHARPGPWEEGVLTVLVDHSVWLQELSRNAKPTLLKRLRARFGDQSLKDIRFRLDPGDRP